MGEAPHWYRVVRASKYLGVPPWELAQQPWAWLQMAEVGQAAEAYAEREQARRKRRAEK